MQAGGEQFRAPAAVGLRLRLPYGWDVGIGACSPCRGSLASDDLWLHEIKPGSRQPQRLESDNYREKPYRRHANE
jgi:hypothetical protein